MTSLHVRTWGGDDGTPVVLLHAGIADSAGWTPVAEQLAARGYRVVAPDLRGFGQSPGPVADFRHADDVLELLDGLRLTSPVVLVGWSMSGTIALDIALEHPERVTALALVCSVPEGLPRSVFVQQSWALEDQLLEAGDLDGAVANDLATWVAGPRRTIDQVTPSVVDYATAVVRDQATRGDDAIGEAQDGDRDAIARLEQVQVPTLVVTADLDTPCHEEAAQVLLERIPGARRIDVPDAAHMAPLERPEAVAAAIADLLEGRS